MRLKWGTAIKFTGNIDDASASGTGDDYGALPLHLLNDGVQAEIGTGTNQ